MTRAINEVVDDLGDADFNVRARALGELVRCGRAATPALIDALAFADRRGQAATALAEIADPSSAGVLASLVDDSDPQVRAHAAFGLARIGDARAVSALVRTIDDFEDVLHPPDTLATSALTGLGPTALLAVVPLLSSALPMTRQRAFLVIQRIVSALPEISDFVTLWRSLGSYDPDSEGPQREQAAAQWRDWMEHRWPGPS